MAPTTGKKDEGSEKPRSRRKTQHMKFTPGQKLTFIRQLEPPDVLLGRGTGPNDHPGNMIFRDFIRRSLRRYEEAETRHAKNDIAIATIRAIRKKKGRFVRRLDKDEAEQVNGWNGRTPLHILIDDENLVLEKTKQCYRHNARKKSYLDDGGEQPEDCLGDDDEVPVDDSGGFGKGNGILDATPEERERLVVSSVTKKVKNEEVTEELETRARPDMQAAPRMPGVSQALCSGLSSLPALHQPRYEQVYPAAAAAAALHNPPQQIPVNPSSTASLMASASVPHPNVAYFDASSLRVAHAHAALYQSHHGAPYVAHHRLAASPFVAHPPPLELQHPSAHAHLFGSLIPSAPASRHFAPPRQLPPPMMNDPIIRPPTTMSNGEAQQLQQQQPGSRRQRMIAQAVELLRAAACEESG